VSPTTFPLLLVPGQTLPGAKTAPNGVQPDLKSPAVFTYSLRVDRALSTNTLFSVGYVGGHGYHLLSQVDANTAYPAIVNGAAYFAPRSPRMNPALSNARYSVSSAISNYNGLVLDLNLRFSHGLQYRLNYTFSKSLDTHSSSWQANAGGAINYMNPFDAHVDYGPSDFNVPHRIAGNLGYELPVGKNKRFLNGGAPLPNAIFGGWQINAIFSAQSGFPFSPRVGFNQSGSGDTRSPDRASVNPSFSGDRITGSPDHWYNPAAWLLPPAGTWGSAGRNILYGPGLLNLDCSMFKMFRIRERLNVEFRAEFFNVLNRTNFGMPVTTTFASSGAYSPSAGAIKYTSTTSRQMQFAMKLNW